MMTVNNNFDLRMVSWNEYADALTAIRHQVFVTEQNVPIDEEVDDFDRAVATQHLLVYLDHKPVACARLLSSGQIGRMAVLVEHRGCGIGRIMLRSLLQRRLADVGDNLNPPFLHAQLHAIGFYRKAGFIETGDVFMDAGIPHRNMKLDRSNADTYTFIYGDEVIRLESAAMLNQHIGQQLNIARRSFDLYCGELHPAIWNKPQIVAAISALARLSRNSSIRILLRDSSTLKGNRNALVQLSQRLPSRMAIRVLTTDEATANISYGIIDQKRLVFLNDEANFVGFAKYNAAAESRHQLDEFERLWQYGSASDPNLAQIFI